MPTDQRLDIRHACSTKAVMLAAGGVGSLGVITNISHGGLCLALVGSSRQQKSERISVKVDRGTFTCNIVKASDEGLHCRFDARIGRFHPDPPILLNAMMFCGF